MKLKLIKIPYKVRVLKWKTFRKRNGEKILQSKYQDLFGHPLDTANPQTFSAKLFTRLVLVNRHGNARYTKLADKLLVRDYVKEKVGDQCLVPLLWSGSKPENIPFHSLPENYIIKTNHGSSGNLIINGAADQAQTIKTLKFWLKGNYYWWAREYHYYKIPPKILIESHLSNGRSEELLDYRIWCFHGEPTIIFPMSSKRDINPAYDPDWKKLDIRYRPNPLPATIEKPSRLGEMLSIARLLSADFDFVRVDLYHTKKGVFFSELTFTPNAGVYDFKPECWDLELGRKWLFKHENQIT